MARKIGTIKSFLSLWEKHKDLYFSIFFKALQQLKISDEQRNDEDAISEVLCPVLRKICYNHEYEIRTPAWEKPNQPVSPEELRGGKIRKRPDFTCNFLNTLADSPETYEIPFHVECKRLGKKKGSWDLNKNYVTNGVKRFDSRDHEYGKRASSGMMIGYITNMDKTAILAEVNKNLPKYLPKLDLMFLQKVVSCEQELTRKYVKPKEFKIIHIWADLKIKV